MPTHEKTKPEVKWRRGKSIMNPVEASVDDNMVAIACLSCTFRDMYADDVRFWPAQVPVDTAAELASEWLGGPYVVASSRAANVSWFGMQPVFILEHDIVIQALIVEEADAAMRELEEMLQDGRWKPTGGMEWFRLQRHERLPMISWNDVV